MKVKKMYWYFIQFSTNFLIFLDKYLIRCKKKQEGGGGIFYLVLWRLTAQDWKQGLKFLTRLEEHNIAVWVGIGNNWVSFFFFTFLQILRVFLLKYANMRKYNGKTTQNTSAISFSQVKNFAIIFSQSKKIWQYFLSR